MATNAPGDVAPRNWAAWLLNNIGSATWWRSRALSQGVTDEGGVDVPLTAGTPIYALATGPLRGAGYFYHGGPYFSTQEYGASANAPGYGVVSEQVNVPGLGLEDLYYQHIDIAPGINLCQSGNCGGQVVQEGQLIGYSKNPPGEAEVGLGANTSWGGIWGAVSDPGQWVSDPRSALTNLASSGGGPVTPTGTKTNCTSVGGDCYIPDWCCAVPGGTPVMSVLPPCNCGGANPIATTTTAAYPGLNTVLGAVTSPSWWTRVGIGLFAVLLILGAMFLFIKDTR